MIEIYLDLKGIIKEYVNYKWLICRQLFLIDKNKGIIDCIRNNDVNMFKYLLINYKFKQDTFIEAKNLIMKLRYIELTIILAKDWIGRLDGNDIFVLYESQNEFLKAENKKKIILNNEKIKRYSDIYI